MRDDMYQQAMETDDFWAFQRAFHTGCSRCTLSQHGCPPILWRGNPESNILLIGEGPGQEEEKQKRPFVGPAGELLDKIMDCIGLNTNKDMMITNCTFCRATAPKNSGKQNYTPKKEQIIRCWPFVERIIDVVDPAIIISCGRTALCALMEDDTMKMGQWEGKWLTHKTGRKVFATMHTAALLHKAPWPDEQAKMKRKVWEYMQCFRDSHPEKIEQWRDR